MPRNRLEAHLEKCWEACWHHARRPVEGVVIPDEKAAEIAERVLRNLAFDYDEEPPEAEFTARALEQVSQASRDFVASQRRDLRDPQTHHDSADRRYDRNLDLDRLQRHDPQLGFHDSEWNHLPQILRPLTFSVLSRKGITGHDAEDVFSDTLVELVKEREGSGHAPILDPTVFEEIIPLHSRIVRFRAIDWYRRRSTLKNQPNAGDSIDALGDDPDRPVQFEDPSSARDQGHSFERIYKECHEALTPKEWKLIFILFVSQSETIQDLVQDDAFCVALGAKPGSSASTRRRLINERVEEALEKIRNNLAD